MKKFTAILLILVLVLTCVVASACFFLPRGSHTHKFESYFTYGKCTVAGCNVYGRNQASSKYFKSSDYMLDSLIPIIDGHYDSLVSCIESGTESEFSFQLLYLSFYGDVEAVVEQFNLIYLLSDIDDRLVDKYYDASDYYDKIIAQFYGLYEKIYNSDYRDYFYDAEYWTQEDIDEALELAAMYNDKSEDSSELSKIMREYTSLIEEIESYLESSGSYNPTNAQYSSINSLYARLVGANNSIASSEGYGADNNKNYMDYAYDNVYYREYSPSDVSIMRDYVKSTIAPIFMDIVEEYYYFDSINDMSNYNYYMGLVELSIVDTVTSTISNFKTISNTVNYIGSYFSYLSEVNGVDFFTAANELYKNGNYFTGTGEGAYTTVIKDKPIVYFQQEGYDTAFTFVHEFGHYYDYVHNGGLTSSMDHAETQSQGDEMMFLAWLSQNKPSGIDGGFSAVELEQLFNFLATVILATAVDEFEQAAYSGVYNGAAITDYNATFSTILHEYSGADEYLNTDYWFYVVFDNPAYYISYAMSALPAIEIYAKAGTEGLDAARTSYLKLFTYSSNSSFMGTDSYGGATVTASYEQILNWCGLHSAFQSQLYTTIQSYFNNRKQQNVY